MSKKPKFILSTEAVNTYGAKLLASGARTEYFKSNPVMQYMHRAGEVIGRWENLRLEDGVWVADADFDMADEFAAKIAGKVDRGFIKAASVTVRPLSGYVDESTGEEVFVCIEWELREASIVDIPSDRGALRLVDAKGVEIKLGEDIKLSDIFPTPLKPAKSMDLKEIAKELKLSDDATDAEIMSAIRKHQKAAADLEDMKTKQIERQKADALKLADAAVADGRLKPELKDKYLTLADTNFDLFKDTLDSLPKAMSLTDTLRTHQQAVQAPKGRETWSFSDWQEKDGDGLYHMAKNNFDAYSKLFKEEHGVEPSKDVA